MTDLFTVTVGSRAFGLDHADSDYDVRTIRAQTMADLYAPYPEALREAPGWEAGTRAGVVEHQALDYGKFIRQLADQDINAWVILMSDMNEAGWTAQFELRELAVDLLLDSRKLLSNAQKRAKAMLNEAWLKGSGKVAANGLSYIIFALNMGRIIPSPALSMGLYTSDLRVVKTYDDIDIADEMLAELLDREQSFVRVPDPEHSIVNERFMDYYHRWVE